MRNCLLAGLTLVLLTVALVSSAAPYQAWLDHQAALAREPGLIRYYPLGVAPGGSLNLANLAGPGGTLAYAPSGELQLAPGRWPEQATPYLDEGWLQAQRFSLPERALTVEGWFRITGYGVHRGNSGSTTGTLISLGVGYWDGFRISYDYPNRTLGFEIGRPQPVGSVQARSGVIGDYVWHHIVATWDGQQMALYVDGLLVAEGAYDGPYYEPAAEATFRLGFADYGIGSVKLQVSEAALYSRALSKAEIQAHAWFATPPTAQQVAEMDEAAHMLRQGRGADSAKALEQVAAGLSSNELAQALRLQAAWVWLRAGKAQETFMRLYELLADESLSSDFHSGCLALALQAVESGQGNLLPPAILEELMEMEGLNPAERRSLKLEVALSSRDAKQFDAAQTLYDELLTDEATTAQQALELKLLIIDTFREAGNYKAARAGLEALIAAPDTPTLYRSLAQLRFAGTWLAEQDWSQAREAYKGVLLMVDAPQAHQEEAREKLKEVARLGLGMPARDPNWYRMTLPQLPQPSLTLHVNPKGSAKGDGSKGKPFATLNQARDAIRALKASSGLPAGGIEVLIAEGRYEVGESLELTSEDSGAPEAPIVWQAEHTGKAIFSGTKRLTGFSPVTDEAILARLPEVARTHVMQTDVVAQGVSDLGEAFIWSTKPEVLSSGSRPELYFNGKPMTLARWPNEGWLRTGELKGEQPFAVWGVVPGNHDGRFTFDYDRADRWKDERDLWLYGYWFWDWADGYERVASVDLENRVLTTTPPYHGYGFRSNQRYRVVNALAELDEPGEWYLDRDSGLLYFWPPDSLKGATVELAALAQPFIQATDVAHLVLQGLTFEGGRTNGLELTNCESCLVAGCTIQRLGEDGVVITEGHNTGLFGCDMATLGKGGTRITGGDRKTLEPGDNFIENCIVRDFSRIYRTYKPAVWMDGCGNRIAHNLFYDSPHHAMRIEGNDHEIIFNEIHSMVYEADDQAGLDMWWNPTYRGVKINYNYWHDIGSALGTGQAGIRLDDAICGVEIYGNVFRNCAQGAFGAVQIHGGKENVVDNNLFLDCQYAVSFSPWGEGTWIDRMRSEEIRIKTHEEVDITRPPYSTMYPALADLEENPDSNNIWRNLVVNCGRLTERDRGVNVLADNYMTGEDPGFVDLAGDDLTLKPDAKAYFRLGLTPIPFEEMGLYQHPWRATWPVENKLSEAFLKAAKAWEE